MDPIFEVLLPGPAREIRVGDDVYPVFTPYALMGRSCTPAALIEAPLAVGTLHGWTRRLDVEHARKLRYQAMGQEAAAMMWEATDEGAEQQARLDAERQELAAADAQRADAEAQEQAIGQYVTDAELQARAEMLDAACRAEEAKFLASTEHPAPTPAPPARGSRRKSARG